MRDLIADLDQTRRAVTAGRLRESAAHVVTLRRRLDAPIENAWSACTDPERVARWFLALSGDLRLGGRYALEGNASGTITACEPPRRLEVTWEFGGLEPGLVVLELSPATDGATELTLSHTVADDEHWARYGPGAVGLGWDLTMPGLALVAGNARGDDDGAGGDDDTPPSKSGMTADPRMPAAVRRLAAAWGAAHEASGAAPETACAAAARTSDFYAPEQPASR